MASSSQIAGNILKKRYPSFIAFGLVMFSIFQWQFKILRPNFFQDKFEAALLNDSDFLYRVTALAKMLFPTSGLDINSITTLPFYALETAAISLIGVVVLGFIKSSRNTGHQSTLSIIKDSIGVIWARNIAINLIGSVGYIVVLSALIVLTNYLSFGFALGVFVQIATSVAIGKLCMTHPLVVYDNNNLRQALGESIRTVSWPQACFYIAMLLFYKYILAAVLAGLSLLPQPANSDLVVAIFGVLGFIGHVCSYAVWAVTVDNIYQKNKSGYEVEDGNQEISDHLIQDS